MTFKLINLNLWYGGMLMPNMLEFLDKEKPDILTLQEVFDLHDKSFTPNLRSVDLLKEHLGLSYSSFGKVFREEISGMEIDRGNAILSRFPIKESASHWLYGTYGKVVDVREHFKTHPRNMQRASIDVHGKLLNVYNLQGIWDEHGDDTSERIEMCRIIADEVKNKENVILAGDFNLKPTTKAVEKIKRSLTSVFENDLKTSFNMRRKDNPGYATAVVDMVFVSNDLRVTNKYAPDVDVSDHLPLVVEFEI